MGHLSRKENSSGAAMVDPLVLLVDARPVIRFEQPGVVKSSFSDIQHYLADNSAPLIPASIANLCSFEDLEWHRQKLSQTTMYLGHVPPAIISDRVNLVQNAAATIVIDEDTKHMGNNGKSSPKKLSLAAIAYTKQERAESIENGITITSNAMRVIAARFSLSGRGNLESLFLSFSFPEQKFIEALGNDSANEAFTELLLRLPTMRDEPRSHPGFITDTQRKITDDTEGIQIRRGWHGFHFGAVSELDDNDFNRIQVFAKNLGFSLCVKKNMLQITFDPPDPVPDLTLPPGKRLPIFPKPPSWTIPFPIQLAEPKLPISKASQTKTFEEALRL